MANITIKSPYPSIWPSGNNLRFDINVDTSGYMFIDFDNTLECWYRFELEDLNRVPYLGGSGIYDWSGKGRHGKLLGTINPSGAFGSCLEHTNKNVGVTTAWGGNHYITFPENRGMTFAGWVKTVYTGSHQDIIAINNISVTAGSTGLRAYIHSGSSSCMVVLFGDKLNGPYSYITTSGFPVKNAWAHYAAVFEPTSPTTLKQYFNGVLVQTTTTPYTRPFTMWKEVRDSTYFYASGCTDELLVFSRALSANEIQALCGVVGDNLTTTISVNELDSYSYRIYHIDLNGKVTSSNPQKIIIDDPNSLPKSLLLYPANSSSIQDYNCKLRFLAESSTIGHTLSSGIITLAGPGYYKTAVVSLSGIRQEYVYKNQFPVWQSGINWNVSIFDNYGLSSSNSVSGVFSVNTQNTFYVSTSGNDSNSGTSSQPFATIQKFCNIAKAGDTCIIYSGDYRESITLNCSGTERQPITIKSAPNEIVTINGCDLITGWVAYSGNIYKTNFPAASGRGLDQIFCDGDGWTTYEARYPSCNTYLDYSLNLRDLNNSTLSSGNSYAMWIVASGLTQPSGHWIGSTIQTCFNPRYHAITGYVNNSYPINESSGLISAICDTASSATGYYNNFGSYGVSALIGSVNCINSSGQWAIDYNTKDLYLWTLQGDDPTNHIIEVKKRFIGLQINASYIYIDNIRLFGCNIKLEQNAHHCKLSNITNLYPSKNSILNNSTAGVGSQGIRDTGIILNGHHNILYNSTILYSYFNGVSLLGYNNTVDKCIIKYCNWMCTSSSNIHFGDMGVRRNVVKNCELGYNNREVLTWSDSIDCLISHNKFYGSCWNGWIWDAGQVYAIATDGHGVLEYNHFYDGIVAYPIYYDAGCRNYLTHHNLVEMFYQDKTYAWDTSILVNEPHYNMKFYHNTCLRDIYLDRYGAGDTSFGDEVKNNICQQLRTRVSSTDTPNSGICVESNNLEFQYSTALQRSGIFVDEANDDFRLKTGGVAVGSGIYLGYMLDMSGVILNNPPSIGCYEYI